METHQKVFNWVLGVQTKASPRNGETMGIDATPLEANPALRSILRPDAKVGHGAFLTCWP